MSDPSTADPRLAELRRRREADPSPRVFLQLAEEYRRQGRHDDALVVLESGLAEVPGYLSLQVSLGRLRLDRGEAAEATAVLERVVARDPTHLVAAKLLVEACLLSGDPEGARLRLDVYRLLNDGDPEIDELAERIALMGRGRGAAGPPPAEDGEDEEEELGRAEEPEPEIAVEPRAPAGLAPVAPEEPGRDPVGDRAERAARGARPAAGEEPFADLLVPDRRRYLAGLARGGIFPVVVPTEPEPPAAESALELEAQAPVAEESIEWAWETAPAEAAAEPVAAEMEPPAFATADADAPEAAVEPAGGVPMEEPVATHLLPAPGAEPVATVTLGQLYLEQQHFGEAERIFRAVLARDPGNAAALLGVAEAVQGRPAPLDAADLLRWARESGRATDVPRAPGSLGARLAVLHAYQTRLATARAKESDVS